MAGTDPYAALAANAPANAPVADPYAALATPTASGDQPSSVLGTVNQWAGLANRALLGGAAGLPSELAGVVQGAGEEVANKLGYQPTAAPPTSSAAPYSPSLSDFVHPEKWQSAAEYFADHALGTPQPQTPAQRVFTSAVQAVPSAVLSPEAPIAGAASAALGSGASQAVAETGGSKTAQVLAGLAAGGLPALGAAGAAAARGIVRGGAQGAADMAGNISNAAANGVPLTVGQASGNPGVQALESASSKLWGGGAIDQTAHAQSAALGGRVNQIVDNLSQGAPTTPTTAGEAINRGVAATRTAMSQAEDAAYQNLEQAIPPNSRIPVSNASTTLGNLTTPTPGAEATTGNLVSPKLQAINDALTQDLTAGNGTLPYSSVRALRTRVGGMVDWGFSPADPVLNGGLKQLYGSLSQDLSDGAAAISPQAQQAAQDANALYASNSAQRDALNTIVNKAGGPEAVYSAAFSGAKTGATKINQVMSALGPSDQNLVRATFLNRLGRAPGSLQNAAGDAFNPSSFLTGWANMSSDAKDALFGSSGPTNQLRTGLDSLTQTLSTLRNSQALKNPSGSGAALGHGLGLAGAFEALGHLAGGHVWPAVGVGSAFAGNAILSRALTNPRVVSWLSQATKAPVSALPNAVNQLSKMGTEANDPDARDMATYLRTTQQ